MTILLPDTATEQVLKYVPMENSAVTKIDILDEQQNITTELDFGTQNENSYWNEIGVTADFLKEGSIYMIFLYADTKLIFSDKVFVTSQPVSTFSVHHGVYKYGPTTPNEYILYGQ